VEGVLVNFGISTNVIKFMVLKMADNEIQAAIVIVVSGVQLTIA